MKFCPNCGKEVTESAKFCPSCGKSTEIEQVAPAVEITQQHQRTPKVFPKKWLIIGIIAVLLVGGGTALGFTLLNGPKELYLMAEAKTYKSTMDQFEDQYGEDLKFQEEMLESPSSSELKLSGNVEMDTEYPDPTLEMVQEILDQAALVIKSDQDPKKQASFNTIGLEMDGSSVVDLELYQSTEQLGLKVPTLYDKYFYLNLDEYGEVMRMVDPYYEGPEKLDLSTIKWDEIKFSDKEIDEIKSRYYEYVFKALKDDYFTLEKNVPYEHDGEKMKLRKITLKMSSKEVETFINGFVDELIEDEKLHGMIADRLAKLANAGLEEMDVDFTDKKEVQKEMKSALKDLKSALKDVDYTDGFKSVILIDKKEQIIDRHMEIAFDGDVNLEVSTKNVPIGKDDRYQEYKIELGPEDASEGKMVFELTNDSKGAKDGREEKMKANFYFEEYEYVVMDFTFKMNSEFKGKNPNKQTIIRDFDVVLDGEDFYDMTPVSGKITQEKDVSVKDKHSNNKFKIEVNVEDEYESGSVVINVDSKVKLKDKVDLPKMDTASGMNVAELTEEDIMEIGQEVGFKLQDLMMELGLY
ncbi:zinc ribbon domain-containing protein [Ferdinandcohnia quinoae]|uniref:Zinc-ribbon domain-containing protein n=1 Tax=Fredinandcohnia quinoae TaxID=2918902 RepID=A0AAW5E9E3_9BACI|nr:zinc ribbon domain-containing protein [Fredinandcohnia sp. SECRCQ15]MCH1627845.1 zinc-ribbon domain-containing protein [Fredinandcohnia sp. SECRCQ15]